MESTKKQNICLNIYSVVNIMSSNDEEKLLEYYKALNECDKIKVIPVINKREFIGFTKYILENEPDKIKYLIDQILTNDFTYSLKLLIYKGYIFNKRDVYKCVINENVKSLDILLKLNIEKDPTLVIESIETGNVKIVKLLIDNGYEYEREECIKLSFNEPFIQKLFIDKQRSITIPSGTVLSKGFTFNYCEDTVNNESDFYKQLEESNLIETFGHIEKYENQEKFTPQGPVFNIMKHKDKEIYFCNNVMFTTEISPLHTQPYYGRVIYYSTYEDVKSVIERYIR